MTENKNCFVSENGQCIELDLPILELPEKPYRLYRFLTEIEDILDSTNDNFTRVQLIIPKVRKLLTSSYWLTLEFVPPQLHPGWSVNLLYDDYEFPLTIQIVSWLPGNISPIHNHGTWGVVAIIDGQEKNSFWQKNKPLDSKEKIEKVGDRILKSGDIISFLPDAIHSVETIGEEPTISFNLYGETNYDQRFEFDSLTGTAKSF